MLKRGNLKLPLSYFKLKQTDKTDEPFVKSFVDDKQYNTEYLARYQFTLTPREEKYLSAQGKEALSEFHSLVKNGDYVTLKNSVILQVDSGPKFMEYMDGGETAGEKRTVWLSNTTLNRLAVGFITEEDGSRVRMKTSFILFRRDNFIYTKNGIVYKLEHRGRSLGIASKYHLAFAERMQATKPEVFHEIC